MLFVDKLSVSVFPAAFGSKLNVNSFPFPGLCEVGQTLWTPQPQIPFLRIGPFPKATEESSWYASVVPCDTTVQKWGCLR